MSSPAKAGDPVDDPSGRDTDRHGRDKLVECRANASDVSGPTDGLSRRPHRACDSLASIQNLSWVALNLPLAVLTGISDRSRDILSHCWPQSLSEPNSD